MCIISVNPYIESIVPVRQSPKLRPSLRLDNLDVRQPPI